MPASFHVVSQDRATESYSPSNTVINEHNVHELRLKGSAGVGPTVAAIGRVEYDPFVPYGPSSIAVGEKDVAHHEIIFDLIHFSPRAPPVLCLR